jgi:hypothetical protein
VRAVRVLRPQGHLVATLEIPNVVDVQRARVSSENDGLRREGVDECGRIDTAIGAIQCQYCS